MKDNSSVQAVSTAAGKKEDKESGLAALPTLEDLHRQLAASNVDLGEARQLLDQTFRKYQALYQLSPIALVRLDRKGCIIELNEGAAKLLGFSSKWLLRRPFVVFVAKAQVFEFLATLNQLSTRSDNENLEIPLALDRRAIPVQLAIKSDVSDGTVTYVMALHDLTESKKLAAHLAETLANWTALVQHVPDIIMSLTRDGRIVFVNRPAWGYSPESLLGTALIQYLPVKEKGAIKRSLLEAFRSSGQIRHEFPTGSVGGSWLSLTFSPNSSAPGNPGFVTLMITDITAHKRREAELRNSGDRLRRLAAREEVVREEERTKIAREIHDDLGQALTLLKLDLAWIFDKAPSLQRSHRSKLKSVLKQVDDTIGRVRTISASLRPAILDDLGLVAAIEWQLAQLKKRTRIDYEFKSAHLHVDLPAEVRVVLFRVVQEALTNVMRHSGARKVYLSVKSVGGNLQLAIRDNGAGASEERLNDPQSLGVIGMKERVMRVGGELGIVSVPGKGTTLMISVPLPSGAED